MIRLHIIAEGQAELNFAKKMLAPYLAVFNIFVDARAVMTSRNRYTSHKYSGGLTSYGKAKNDIKVWLTEDRWAESRFTTMFDFYGLPQNFPGYADIACLKNPYERVRQLETALVSNIDDRQSRFIPYIQLHEFEVLIFADPRQLDWEYWEHDAQIQNLIAVAEGQEPELINDGRDTAPSKRIIAGIPEYKKPRAGVAVVEKIGMRTLRAKCKHFNEWVSQLESLAGGSHE